MAVSIKVKVIVPKEILNVQRVVDEIAKAQRDKTAPDLKRMFKQTVEGWKNPPDFSQKQRISPSEIAMAVFASGSNADKYTLVNEGSPKHPIVPRQARMLRFRTGYRAGTQPRVLRSQAYQRFGNYISTMIVPNHPGFKAREFDDTIAKEYKRTFEKDMQEAINRGSR